MPSLKSIHLVLPLNVYVLRVQSNPNALAKTVDKWIV